MCAHMCDSHICVPVCAYECVCPRICVWKPEADIWNLPSYFGIGSLTEPSSTFCLGSLASEAPGSTCLSLSAVRNPSMGHAAQRLRGCVCARALKLALQASYPPGHLPALSCHLLRLTKCRSSPRSFVAVIQTLEAALGHLRVSDAERHSGFSPLCWNALGHPVAAVTR